MEGAVKSLQTIGTRVRAAKVILFGFKRDTRVEVSSWQKDTEVPRGKVDSLFSFPIRREDDFYGVLQILEPNCSIQDACSFVSGELDTLVPVLKSFKKKSILPRLFIAESEGMKQLLEKVGKAARSKAPVLLLGESGCGKTEVARLIHEKGVFKDKPFIALHCTTIPETLFESELFGYTKGSFTGAAHNKKGLVEEAAGGTLFLDEIGDLPEPIQAKLLRFVETGNYYQIGGRELKHVKVRIICATSKDLKQMIKEDLFRPELFYRIAGLQLHVPSLKERRQEVPIMARYFLERACFESGMKYKELTPGAEKLLKQMEFPGNVRELANLMESVVVFVEEDGKITAAHLRKLHRTDQGKVAVADLNLGRAKRKIEESYIREALTRYKTIEEAASALGITRKSLWRKRQLLEE